MTEALEKSTNTLYVILYYATMVSFGAKQKDVVVYALAHMKDKVFVRDRTEFERMFEIR